MVIEPEWYIYGNAEQGNFATVKGYDSQKDSIYIYLNGPSYCVLEEPPYGYDLEYPIRFVDLSGTLNSNDYSFMANNKEYTIKDHLGNPRVKFTDVRFTDLNAPLNITGVYNYYPYGTQIENRCYEAPTNRFGFQGQQRDDEITGKGNMLSTFYRENSTQTANWNSIDPKSDLYPSKSPYVLYGNNPIVMVDPMGDADYYTINLTWIGTNGKNDNTKYIVTEKSTQNIILRETFKGNIINYTKDSYRDILKLPTKKEFDALAISLSKMGSDGHEEGGYSSKATGIHPAKPGAPYQNGAMEVFVDMFDSQDGTQRPSWYDFGDINMVWHIHPSPIPGVTPFEYEPSKKGVNGLTKLGDIDLIKDWEINGFTTIDALMIKNDTRMVKYYDGLGVRGSIYFETVNTAINGNCNNILSFIPWFDYSTKNRERFEEAKKANSLTH